MKNLRGKNCLLTGAASGIGRALAHELARQGMNLCLVDLDMEGLERVKAELEPLGAVRMLSRTDVANREEVNKLAEESWRRLGGVDLLINNAGIGGAGLVEELEPEDWKRVLDVNLWSIVYAIRAFLPRMLERGTGHFVNTASGAGIVGVPYHIQYVASKFAVVGITEALYSEIKHVHKGIQFSAICPTYLRTNIIGRSYIRLSEKFVVDASRQELEARRDEFSRIFWEKYTRGAPSLESVAKKYVRGIKKGRLYIFDSRLLNVAMVLKGLSDRLYKRALRKEGGRDLKIINETIADMGLRASIHS